MSREVQPPRLTRRLSWTPAAALVAVLHSAGPALAGTPAAQAAQAPEDEAQDPTADPLLIEASRYFRLAEERDRERKPVAAADLYIAAYDLLDDPRKYRNERGTALAKIYGSLMTAYEEAGDNSGRISHACTLRNVMSDYLAGIKASYGEAGEEFPEVHTARDKLHELELTIGAHGDPETLCETPNDQPRKPVAMIDPAVATGSLGPAVTQSVESSSSQAAEPERSARMQPVGPVDAGFDADIEPTRDRKAVALTAVGGSAIGLGAASLGVAALYISRGAQTNSRLRGLKQEVTMRPASDEGLTEEEEAEVNSLRRDGSRFNTIAVATGIAGGVALLSGVIMTAVGGKRLRSRQVAMAPNATITSLGATLRLQF